MHVANKGFMIYCEWPIPVHLSWVLNVQWDVDGVHVICHLTQVGRTLIAVPLNYKTENLQPLVPPPLEALRSCVGSLRRCSGRYSVVSTQVN